MTLKRSEKEAYVESLAAVCREAQMAILCENAGLTVAQFTDLRNKMRSNVLLFKVVKNTLLNIAAKGTAVEALEKHFSGVNVLALAKDDPVSPSKTIKEFAKKNDKLRFKAAMLDGAEITSAAFDALAELPSYEELIATLMGTMQAPTAQMVGLLSNVMGTFVSTLDAYREKLEKAA